MQACLLSIRHRRKVTTPVLAAIKCYDMNLQAELGNALSFSEGGRTVGSQGLHIGTGAPND